MKNLLIYTLFALNFTNLIGMNSLKKRAVVEDVSYSLSSCVKNFDTPTMQAPRLLLLASVAIDREINSTSAKKAKIDYLLNSEEDDNQAEENYEVEYGQLSDDEETESEQETQKQAAVNSTDDNTTNTEALQGIFKYAGHTIAVTPDTEDNNEDIQLMEIITKLINETRGINKCPIPNCKKKLTSIKSACHHLETHLHGNYFECNECTQKFKTTRHLSQHDRSCGKICTECGKKFTDSQDLKQHLLSERHFDNRDNDTTRETFVIARKYKITPNCEEDSQLLAYIVSNLNTTKCHKCEKECDSACNLKVHLENHLVGEYFECEHGQRFRTRKILSDRHTGKFKNKPCKQQQQCSTCNIICENKTSLSNHMHEKHSSDLIECNICKQRFINIGKLNRHIAKEHKQPYECACGKKFSFKCLLKKHQPRCPKANQDAATSL